MTVPVSTPAAPADAVVGKLSTLDRFLPVWIGVAILAGLLLGRGVPSLNTGLQKWRSMASVCPSRSGC